MARFKDAFHAQISVDLYTDNRTVEAKLLFCCDADEDYVHVAANTVAELVALGAAPEDIRHCRVYHRQEDIPKFLLSAPAAVSIGYDLDGTALIAVEVWERRGTNGLHEVRHMANGCYIENLILAEGWRPNDEWPYPRKVDEVPEGFRPRVGERAE